MAKSKKVEKDQIQIDRIRMKRILVPIKGITPLVCHAWSQKAIREMLEKQLGVKNKTKVKENRDPDKEYQESMYQMKDGSYGAPCTWFKCAMERAAKTLKDAGLAKLDMILLRQLLFVLSDGDDIRTVVIPMPEGEEYRHSFITPCVKIEGEPIMRTDCVRVGNGAADIRFRGMFENWTMKVPIEYNEEILSGEMVANLMYRAGQTVGIGEGRPGKKDMGWGRFVLDM